jgi:orotate phosphoribosyltransferase
MNWRDEIQKFVKNREGELAEGEPRLYADVKSMISQPQLLHAVITEMGDLVLRNHPNIKAIGSHGVGGSFLVSPIMLYIYTHWFDVNGFFLRLEDEGSGHHPIEGFLERGWRVLIVDTMIKTGKSSLKAHEILQAHGFHVDGMIVVVDLSHGDNACTRAGLKVESLMTL